MFKPYKKAWENTICKNGQLRNTIILSVILVCVLPLYHYLIIYPSLNKFLTESLNAEAVRIAQHFLSMFDSQTWGERKDLFKFDVSTNLENSKGDLKVHKIKAFSKTGEIIFSTDPEDVGNINNQGYFHEIVAKGNIHLKDIPKETESLEGQLMPANVVETYVPVMSGEKFIGAFEIYYDVTDKKQHVDKLLTRSSAVVFAIGFGLLIAIVVVLFNQNKIISERNQAEKDREKLLAELQEAVAKIITLRGILFICSNCKKIRDDKGYWNQIESYIRDHSDAEFSHSVCPQCAKELYPEFIK